MKCLSKVTEQSSQVPNNADGQPRDSPALLVTRNREYFLANESTAAYSLSEIQVTPLGED